jgi:hypothetical protein
MAKTLLDGVNEVLKKTDVLDSDAGLLTSLTDSARQSFIDLAVQALNETLDDLYHTAKLPKPKQLRESTLTLETGKQAYPLHSEMIELRREYLLIDETNNHFITILGETGYQQIIIGDLEQDDTGKPNWCAIRPTDGKLFFDRTPTSDENGLVYKYRFLKDLELTDAKDVFPFTNPVFRAVIVAATEMWKLHRHNEFSKELYDHGLARAMRLLNGISGKTSWMPRRVIHNTTDPMSDDTTVS